MNLYLRKVVDLQAHENYRVVLKLDGNEFVGSIGIQHGAAWRWEIDTVIPMRVLETQGKGKNRRDCMRQFKAAFLRTYKCPKCGYWHLTHKPQRRL
jgi:hypothetical protein